MRIPSIAFGALLLWLLHPPPALPQARIESIFPEGTVVHVERLGSVEPETAAVGMELLPGDMVTSELETTLLELNCPPDSGNSPRLDGVFRVMIDVPTTGDCNVSLLAGSLNVLSETPTEVNSGGVQMGSVGTQYAVRVGRTSKGLIQRLLVFDGEVRVTSEAGTMRVGRGSSLVLDPSVTEVKTAAISRRDVVRSAELYSAFDMNKAVRAGAEISDQTAFIRQLTSLHYQVLTNPDDQDKRVELAKTQVRYRVNNEALYNLKRANVIERDDLERNEIDAKLLQRHLSPTNLEYLESRLKVPEKKLSSYKKSGKAMPVGDRSVDADLELIEAGRAKEALENLLLREKLGHATSRDYFTLSKAYLELKDEKRCAASAKKAMELHQTDGRLSNEELRELKSLLARLGQ